MKKINIKNVLLTAIAILGIFALGSINSNAENKTSYGHFSSRKIGYYVNASSARYKTIWNNAINEFNETNGTLKLYPTTKTKAKILYSSCTQRGNGVGRSGFTKTSFYKSFVKGYSYINRNQLSNLSTDSDDVKTFALAAVTRGVGLRINNTGQRSITQYDTSITSLTSADKANIAKAYKNVK